MKKDQIAVMTTGDYSDYQIHTHIKALVDFDISAAAKKYEEENPKKERKRISNYGATKGQELIWYQRTTSMEGFIAYLMREKLVEVVDIEEYHSEYDFSGFNTW